MNVVDWTVKEAVTPVKNREPCVEQTKRLSWSLGMACCVDDGPRLSDLLVRWSWLALAMVPFRFVVFQRPHDQIEVLLCLCAVATAVKINLVSQGLLQDLHTK